MRERGIYFGDTGSSDSSATFDISYVWPKLYGRARSLASTLGLAAFSLVTGFASFKEDAIVWYLYLHAVLRSGLPLFAHFKLGNVAENVQVFQGISKG